MSKNTQHGEQNDNEESRKDLASCPVCGSEEEGPIRWLYRCGCETTSDPTDVLQPCRNAHRIAIERGEEIERLKNLLYQKHRCLCCGQIICIHNKKNLDSEWKKWDGINGRGIAPIPEGVPKRCSDHIEPGLNEFVNKDQCPRCRKEATDEQ